MEKRLQPQAFLSYAHKDDGFGDVSRFRENLVTVVEMVTGSEFEIFQDRPHIVWGENWERVIRESLGRVMFLIPIVSPLFFNSEECRKEVSLFLERERRLERDDLILPVYLMDSDVFNDPSKPKQDPLAEAISKHHWADWRAHRRGSYRTRKVGDALEKLARDIKAARERVAALPAAARRASEKGPAAAATGKSSAQVRGIVESVGRRARAARPAAARPRATKTPAAAKTRRKAAEAARKQTGAPRSAAARYEISVFISFPLDEARREMFEALVFAVHAVGFTPRSLLETAGAATARLEKLQQIIAECKYGVFDISQAVAAAAGGPGRFNMPLELGLFLGSDAYGRARRGSKHALVMDRKPFRYQRLISDLAGQDIFSHRDDPRRAVSRLRDWLTAAAGLAHVPGAADIYQRYRLFKKQLPAICRQLQTEPRELTFVDYSHVVAAWLGEFEAVNRR